MQKLSISGPADLVAIIPYQLGFRPERSVVIACLDGNTLGLVARLDVVPTTHDASLSASQFMQVLRRETPTSVVLIGFEDTAGESRPLSEALGVALGLERIPVRADLVVRHGRLYSLRDDGWCPDAGEPLARPEDVPAVAGYVAAGRAVLDDRAALATLVAPASADGRDALVEEIRSWRHAYVVARLAGLIGLLEADPAQVDAWIDDLEVGVKATSGPRPAFLTRLDGPVGAGRRLSPDLATELRRAVADAHDAEDGTAWELLVDESLEAWGALLRGEVGASGSELEDLVPALVGPLEDRNLRDALIAWITPGSMSLDLVEDSLREGLEIFLGEAARPLPHSERSSWGEDSAHVLQDRVDRVCRATPREFAPPVLSVAASLAYWRGDGPRAGACVDHALEIDPDHRLCRLLRMALDHGVRPQVA